jgi:LmbE family N-acetylglucosaminyl deacetylase
MFLNLSDINSFVILSPHPDDEAMGCSGTAILLNRRRIDSSVVFLTNGERLYGDASDVIAQRRKDEANRASKMLGCREALFLNVPDGEVKSRQKEIRDGLYQVIRNKKPDVVFSPSPLDHHEDHIATSRTALDLLKSMDSFRLVFYEVYSTVRHSHLVDISEIIELKKKVILNYYSSLFEKPDIYVSATLGLNAHRSIFVQRHGYYEAFYVVQKDDDMESILDYFSYKDMSI